MIRYSDLRAKLLEESIAMAHYASETGRNLPTELIDTLELYENEKDNVLNNNWNGNLFRIKDLTSIHNHLSDIIYPSTPGTINMISKEKASNKWYLFLGYVPTIRRLMALGIFSTILLIILTSDSVNGYYMCKSIGLNSVRFLELLTVGVAAMLGTSFASLYKANEHLTEGTFNNSYGSTYAAEFALGVIAGVLLTEYIPLGNIEEGLGAGLANVTIAILGGFSARAVYRILNNLVVALETFVRQNPKEMLKQERQKLTVDHDKKVNSIVSRVVFDLSDLKTKAALGDYEGVKDRIQVLIEEMTKEEAGGYDYQIETKKRAKTPKERVPVTPFKPSPKPKDKDNKPTTPPIFEDEDDNFREEDFIKNKDKYKDNTGGEIGVI